MKNPWKNLPKRAPFLLPSDKAVITQFNAQAKEIHKIHPELLPEPFLGRPDAEIVLLNLNPGYSEDDHLLYKYKYARMVWQKNILHQALEYPFFMLDPKLAKFPGPNWWMRHLKELIQIAPSGAKTVANQVCCVEYFPYHSKKFKLGQEILESQQYGFELVRRAMDRGAAIILMRGQTLWLDAVPALKAYSRKFELNSSQNVTISRKNCPGGFPELEKILGLENKSKPSSEMEKGDYPSTGNFRSSGVYQAKGIREIANANLVEQDIPKPNCSWATIEKFALSFDAYDHWGSFEKCAEIANPHAESFKKTRTLPKSLTELRTSLFFEQRRWRHFGTNPDKDDMTYIRALVEAIRRNVIAGMIG